MKIDRLLSIVILLLNRERITAKELSEKFEVNIRTIYRDVDSINMAGIPIVSFPGNNGGFGIMENFRLSHNFLSISDKSSIISVLKGINTSLDNLEFSSVIEKILTLVPDHQMNDFEERNEYVILDVNPWGMTDNRKGIIKNIQKSISGRKVIEISYSDSEGKNTTRQIEPMSLVLRGYSWYIFAYCLKRSDFRVFKITRIKSFSETDIIFKRKSLTYRQFMEKTLHQTENISIVMKINSKMKLKMHEYLDYADFIPQSDGSSIVNFSFPDDDWLNSFILGLGDAAEIISPFFLRERIKKQIFEMSRKYND